MEVTVKSVTTNHHLSDMLTTQLSRRNPSIAQHSELLDAPDVGGELSVILGVILWDPLATHYRCGKGLFVQR